MVRSLYIIQYLIKIKLLPYVNSCQLTFESQLINNKLRQSQEYVALKNSAKAL